MTPETNDIFVKWVLKKYENVPLNEIELSPEWWDANEKEFRKYHPAAGTFVRSLNTEEFMSWINKFKNKK